MKCQNLFSGKNKKISSVFIFAKLPLRVVKVKFKFFLVIGYGISVVRVDMVSPQLLP